MSSFKECVNPPVGSRFNSGSPRIELQSIKRSGHEFRVPEDFRAKELHPWRLASFSLVLPVPEQVSFLDQNNLPTDFAAGENPRGAYGWKNGRDKGIQLIENPQWDEDAEVFRAPDKKHDWYRKPLVHGGNAWYHDARVRFHEPIGRAIGNLSIDIDVAPTDAQVGQVVPKSELDSCPNLTAHHYLFPPEKDRTVFEITNYDRQVPWADQLRSRKDAKGPSWLKLLSFELLQYKEPNLTDFTRSSPVRTETRCSFLVINVAAENISAATLGFLSATLHKPWNTSQVYLEGQGDKTDLEQLPALRHFAELAIAEIDSKLRRKPSMYLDDSGCLRATDAMPSDPRPFLLPPPQRVAMAIPSPCRPQPEERTESQCVDEQFEFYGGKHSVAPESEWEQGINGSVAEMEGPMLLNDTDPKARWSWQKQWAWQIAVGADSYPEQIPLQTPDNFAAIESGSDQNWSIISTSEGVGMVRTKSANKDGMSYWSLAHTRFLDVLILHMRARAGEAHLRISLRALAAASGLDTRDPASRNQRKYLQKDLQNLELLQLDHIEIRDNLWFRNVPEREIETRILRGLQSASEFDRLRSDFEEKLRTRQAVLRTQFNKISGVIREEEAQVSERTNLVLGIIAAAIGAPDWAAAAGYPDHLLASFVAFLATIAVFAGIVKVLPFFSR
ncbi:hypothetical protein [Corynebacterium sp. NML180780]|uniref:hypothetical protein n=1 Tax=Corynebacterium sp. NML180780 TaxID=2598459 RepID=UPI00119E14AB|nr:hypothetical protein [Corynebacterium sp. NML180780]